MIVTGPGAGGAAVAPLPGPDPLPIPEVRSSESSTLPCVVDTPANFSSRGEFLSSCMRNSGRVCQAFDSFALCRVAVLATRSVPRVAGNDIMDGVHEWS
jgi:hypothetical protein